MTDNALVELILAANYLQIEVRSDLIFYRTFIYISSMRVRLHYLFGPWVYILSDLTSFKYENSLVKLIQQAKRFHYECK